MAFFDEWKKRERNNVKDNGGLEFFEDTHNQFGQYTGVQRENINPYGTNNEFKTGDYIAPRPLPDDKQSVTPRNYQNVVVYKPISPEDVQMLIDFLKRKEPAIVNLDEVDVLSAQRILDFVSGATYALNGSVHRIAGNIFLISPEGVEITVPYGKE